MKKYIIASVVGVLGFSAIAFAATYNIQSFTAICVRSTAFVSINGGANVTYPCVNGTISIVVNPYTNMPQ